MTNEQKNELLSMYRNFCLVFQNKLDTPSLVVIIQAIDDLDFELVKHALSEWIKTEKGFPYPVDVRNKIKPKLDTRLQSQNLANRIWGLAWKHEYSVVELQKTLGRHAWRVISDLGGWEAIRASVKNDRTVMQFWIAQMRDSILCEFEMEKLGLVNYSNVIEKTNEPQVRESKPWERESNPNEWGDMPAEVKNKIKGIFKEVK